MIESPLARTRNMAPARLFIAFFSASLVWSSAGTSAATLRPAIFVFGDSLFDVGNNNNLNTTSKANFPLNGIDFPNKTPTGRFCNGYNTIDWLAKFVGYEQSPPAFMSLTSQAQMDQGVNFASGGSGILDSTGTSITFTTQVENFKSVADALERKMGNKRTANLLSKSLFVVSEGSNDMFGYFSANGPQNATQSKEFIAELINKLSDHLKKLYGYGARKFVFLGISHIGCIPAMRALTPNGECVEYLNGLARIFNPAAKAQLRQLESSALPGMKYSYGNVYDLMSVALKDPSAFGYKEVESACCGSGKFNGASQCTVNATLCAVRKDYLFWDQFHPTEIASMFTAKSFYGGFQRFASPINVEQLARFKD